MMQTSCPFQHAHIRKCATIYNIAGTNPSQVKGGRTTGRVKGGVGACRNLKGGNGVCGSYYMNFETYQRPAPVRNTSRFGRLTTRMQRFKRVFLGHRVWFVLGSGGWKGKLEVWCIFSYL